MHAKLLEAIIRSYNKWQKEMAVLAVKRRPTEHERLRLEEVQRHIRLCLESIRQSSKLQGEVTALMNKGAAITEAERARYGFLRRQMRELNDNIGRSLKLQTDLAALNIKAIANKGGLAEAEKARRAVLRENLEPLALEIRIADKRREESAEDAQKRSQDEARARALRVGKLWTDLAEHMRRRNIGAKKLYRQFDESGSGELSYWEFFKGVQSIGIAFDEDDTDLLMADVDVEEKGVVPFEKFRDKVKERDPARQQRAAARLKAQQAKETKKVADAEAAADPAAQLGGLFGGMFGGGGAGAAGGGGDDEIAEIPDSEEEDDDEDEGVEMQLAKGANFMESGTPVMAMHATGDYFRATITKDNLDGTCDVQFVLSTLGRDPKLPKKKLRSLAAEDQLRALWLEVSRAVGRRGANELRGKTDFAGNLSHDALTNWLEGRHDMEALAEHDKFVLLADVDPLHSGSVGVGRFLEKLEHFRARAKILGLVVFHRHDKEEALQDSDDEESGEKSGDDDEEGGGGKRKTAGYGGGGGGGGGDMSSVSSGRMTELEALIFAMAKRQQELALALSASEARTAALNAAVQSIKDEPVYGGEPLLNKKGSGGSDGGGLFIMPDTKDGQVQWLNKGTGMRFVRQEAGGGAGGGGGKKKKKKKKGHLEDMV
jgi:hypothetical protein